MKEKIPLMCLSLIMMMGISQKPDAARAQHYDDFSQIEDREDVVMEFLNQSNPSETTVEGQIVGFVGKLSSETFPNILKFRSRGAAVCTAVIVGPEALLTAAHCLGSKAYSIRVGSLTITMQCYYSPTYSHSIQHSNDWALCKLDGKIPSDVVNIFETLDVINRPAPGDIIMLTGYGCTVEDGESSDELLYGYARTVARPLRVFREDTAFWTQAVVGDRQTKASLCAGDSGGPAFVTGSGGPSDNPRIVGVQSRVNYDLELSWLSATASKTGTKFFETWVNRLDSPICGVAYKGTKYALNCR